MEDVQYFGGGNPPAPPLIAVLQILFQMGCIIGILMTLNFVIEGFTESGMSFFFPWLSRTEDVDKRTRCTELELLTQNLLHANKHNKVIVAMNEIASKRCLALCLRYKQDKLIFCQLDKSVSGSPDQLSETVVLSDGSDVYDIVAVSDGGELWTGLNILKAEKEKEDSKRVQLRDCVVDCWLMKLMVGSASWTSAKEEEMPIRYPKVSKL